MLERGWLGDKTRPGLLQESSARPTARRPASSLDWKTLEYHPAGKPKLPSLEMAKNAEHLPRAPARNCSPGTSRRTKPRASTGVCSARSGTTRRIASPEIADDVAAVDRAMRAGFNWEMGPFEMWDAAGVARRPWPAWRPSLRQRPAKHCSPPARDLLVPPITAAQCFDLVDRHATSRSSAAEGVARVADFRAAKGVVRENPGASLVDLGDGVACIELHSKKNAIGEDIVRMITETLRPDGEAVRNFEAFVITGDRRPVLGGRQPDAASARRAGRGVGRRRHDGARLPAHDHDHQVLPAARGGRALRLLPRRRR